MLQSQSVTKSSLGSNFLLLLSSVAQFPPASRHNGSARSD